MKIKFLGTGTSQGVPVIACQCIVCRSDSHFDKRLRSSILISYDDKNIIVDTGPDFRYQMLREQVMHLDGVLMTHAHKDHIAGLDDVRAFNFKQQSSIDIFGTKALHDALKREFYYAFSNTKYPGIPQLELVEIEALQSFTLFDKEILPLEVMHHNMPVLGFRIDDFAYITDAKTFSLDTKEKLTGLKVLIINALQKESHISHMNLDEAILFAQEIGAEQTYLTHIGHRMGLHAVVSSELPEHIALAYDQLEIHL